jgi:translation initiation factor IF-1
MPRNNKGGNKAKKKSNKFIKQASKQDAPLPCEEENSHVGKVTGVLGDKRFNILYLSDTGLKNEKMIAHLSKTASRRQGRIILDSIIKVSKRDFEDKADILYQYSKTEIDYLIQNNIISNIEQRTNSNEDFDFCDEETDNININEL